MDRKSWLYLYYTYNFSLFAKSIDIKNDGRTCKVCHYIFSFKYQVIVVPTSEADVSWTVGTTNKEDFTNIINYNGLDIHIFRFNRTEIANRSTTAKNWIKKNENSIRKELRLGTKATIFQQKNTLTSSIIFNIFSDTLLCPKRLLHWRTCKKIHPSVQSTAMNSSDPLFS